MRDERPRFVLVLDPRVRSSLAACRSLGRSDAYRVGVAGYRPDRLGAGPAAVSRHAAWFDVLPDPTGPADAFSDALERLVRERHCDVILATSDATLARLASIAPGVPTFPDVGPAFRTLTDKEGLACLCAGVDVPYPETRAPHDDAEARVAADELRLPVVVKSARSAEAGPLAVCVALGAQVCRTPEDVVAAVRHLRMGGMRPIVQARVNFDAKVNAAVLRRDGTSELRYAHRVLRETPISGGIGVALQTIPSDRGIGGQAVELVERVCDAAGFSGLVQAEFYRSVDDGRPYLLDVNPRLWGSTSFAERLGQQVVERGVRFALGQPPLPSRPYAIGRRFHTPVGEWRWLREQARPAQALRELVRSTRPWDTFEYVDWRDPLPLAAYVLQAVRPGPRGASGGDGL